MVCVRLLDGEEEAARALDGARARLVRAVLDDPRVSGAVRVVDVDAAVLRIGGMEGEREKTPLAAARDEVADVEERRPAHPNALADSYDTSLLDDEETRGLARGRGEVHRPVEAGGHSHEPKGSAGWFGGKSKERDRRGRDENKAHSS